MDALNMVVTVPSWAYDFCYYYLAVAAVVTIFSLYTIVTLLTLPSIVHKVLPTGTVVFNILIATTVSVLLTMMQFWICRSALKPAAGKESFAVACKTDGDCTAVQGTQPAGQPCTCGARGFCGGCQMNNNMQPTAPNFDLQPMGF